MAKYATIREAAEHWVAEFDRIPQGIIQKLYGECNEELAEITPPAAGDRVYVWTGEHSSSDGELVERIDEDTWLVRLDGEDEQIEVSEYSFQVDRDSFLPMWGTMWAFRDPCDEWWLEEKGGLQIMADCGFRIYEQEDYGYIFGIDGAGYSFFDEHWIPLYKARGLKWHDEEETA